MFGVRGLYNFGWDKVEEAQGGGRRVDEEEMMEGGLRGRFSAGGEVYFSAKQRSFGSECTAATPTLLIVLGGIVKVLC
jgi:distribution and morphology protein 10